MSDHNDFDAGYGDHRALTDEAHSESARLLREEDEEKNIAQEQSLLQARADRSRAMVKSGEVELPPELGGEDPELLRADPLGGLSEEDQTLVKETRFETHAQKAATDAGKPQEKSTSTTGLGGPSKAKVLPVEEELAQGANDDPAKTTTGTAFTQEPIKYVTEVLGNVAREGVPTLWHGVRKGAIQTVDAFAGFKRMGDAVSDSLMRSVFGDEAVDLIREEAKQEKGESDESFLGRLAKVDISPEAVTKNLLEMLPEGKTPDTGTEAIISGLGEFLPGFIGGMRLAKGVPAVARWLTRGNTIARTIGLEAGVSAITSGVVLDPNEAKIGDAWVAMFGEEHAHWFLDYMRSGTLNDEGERVADSEMVGRLKNALSDAALGPIFDIGMRGLGGIMRLSRRGGAHLKEVARRKGFAPQQHPFPRDFQASVDLVDVAKEVNAGAHEFGGFTYNMKNGDLAGTPGFSVSVFPEFELRLPADKVGDADVVAYIRSLQDRGAPLDSEGLSVGLWKDDNGQMVYDLVQIVKTEEEAMGLAMKFGQEGIFDLKNMEEIKTGFDIKQRAGLELPNIQSRYTDALSRHTPVENSIAQGIIQAGSFAKRVLDDIIRKEDGFLRLTRKGKLDQTEASWLGNIGAIHLAMAKSGNRETWEKAFLSNIDPKVAKAISDEHLEQVYFESQKQFARYAQAAFDARSKDGAKLFSLDGDPIFSKAPGAVRVTGKEAGAQVSTGLPALERVMMLFEKGRFRADWYDDAVVELKEMFGDDAELFAKIIAALSPLKRVDKNVKAAFGAYQFYKTRGTFEGFANSQFYSTKDFGMFLPNHGTGLDAIEAGAFASGPKVEAFLKAIMGDNDAITIDSWMSNLFFGKDSLTGNQAEFVKNWIRDISARTGIAPRRTQAALWTGALMTDKNVTEEGVLTLMQVIRNHASELEASGKLRVPINLLDKANPKPTAMMMSAVIVAPFLDPEDDRPGEKKLLDGFDALGIQVASLKGDALEAILKGLKEFLSKEKLKPPRKIGERAQQFKGTLLDNPAVPDPSTRESIRTLYDEKVRAQTRRTSEHGTRSDATVLEDAIDLVADNEMTVEFMRNLNPGTTLNDAQTQAMISVWKAEDDKLMTLLANAEKHENNEAAVEAFRKQLDAMIDMTANLLGTRAEAGRTLRQFDDVKGASRIKAENLHRAVRDLTEGVSIRQVMNVLKHSDARARVQILDQVSKGPKWVNSFMELWINSLLSGPKTFVANVGTNAAFQVWEMGERALARKIGQLRNAAVGGEAAIAPGAISQQARGMMEGHKASWNLAWEMFKREDITPGRAKGSDFRIDAADITGTDTGLKVETFRGDRHAISAENLELTGNVGRVADVLGYITRTPTRGLVAGDVYFKGVAFAGHIRQQGWQAGYEEAAAQGLKGAEATAFIHERMKKFIADPPESALKASQDFSEYITFTNDLGKFGQSVQEAANAHPLLKLLMPFTRTPTNILKRSLERSPFGAPKAILTAIKKGGREGDTALARMAMGSSAMFMFASMSQSGLITGRAPVDPSLRKTFFAAGYQPYSVKVGDRWIQYKRTEPIGMIIGAAADFATITSYMDQVEATDLGIALAGAFAANFTSKTYVRGLAEAVNAIQYPERGGKRFAGNILGSFVPASSLLRQVGGAFDNELKDVNTVLERIMSGIPGLAGKLNPRRGLFGEKRYFAGGVGSDMLGPAGVLNDAVNPYYITEAKKPHIEVYQRLWDNEIGIPDRPKALGNVKLTAEQRDILGIITPMVTIDGMTMEEALKDTFASESWESNSTPGIGGLRNGMVQQVIRAYYQQGVAELRSRFPDLDEAITRDTIDTAVRRSDQPDTDVDAEVQRQLRIGR